MPNNPFGPDIEAMVGHCGLALIGSGICKDLACRRRAPHLIDGYCASCAARHGVQVLKLTPEAEDGHECTDRCHHK